MRRIITKAQTLQKKAAELRQAVHGLPAQAAKIREAVTMTGGELHQLRSEVQSSITSLRVDNEDRLLKTMREINDHAEVLSSAGYVLAGMDLDLALNQRLAVHLDRVEEVPLESLRYLSSRQSVESIRSILGGILKAEETAANVELSALEYTGVIIHAGPLPMIRLLWREIQTEPEPVSAPALAAASFTPPAPASQTAFPSLGSMFEPRPMPDQSASAASTAAASAVPAQPLASAAPPPKPTPESSWSSDALQRFKKMPGASKY